MENELRLYSVLLTGDDSEKHLTPIEMKRLKQLQWEIVNKKRCEGDNVAIIRIKSQSKIILCPSPSGFHTKKLYLEKTSDKDKTEEE